MMLKFFHMLKLNKKLFGFIQICFYPNLSTPFVNKHVFLAFKITLISHNASHARGFYRSKNYPKPSEALILANRQVLTVFRSNFIYTFGKFWDPFSFALQTNVCNSANSGFMFLDSLVSLDCI